jgi:diguanylate cyclase (GGDEF)-like protein/hemerythrin-like metal-binding protein
MRVSCRQRVDCNYCGFERGISIVESGEVYHPIPLGEAFHKLTKILEFLVCGVVLIDEASHRVVYANDVAMRLSQWEENEILGGYCYHFICPTGLQKCPMKDEKQSGDFSEKVISGKLGNNISIINRVKRVELDGRPYILESFTDIRAQKDKQTKLQNLHETDTLTGLPNRASLERMVEEIYTKNINEEMVHSLIMVDMDLLKNVNDTYGHQAGDDVLRELGSILKASMRKMDIVYRWGGDEFLIFAYNTDGPTAMQIAERLRSIINETQFPMTGHVTASFGVAQSRKGESFDKWFRRTDFCLSKAKKEGRNRVEDWESFINIVWKLGHIPWIRILISGNDTLDDEHRHILDEINDLFNDVNPYANEDKQYDLITHFVTEYEHHMEKEEKLFQDSEFPLTDHHKAEHQRIHGDLIEQKLKLKNKTTDYFSIVDYIIREIFVYHMTMEDTKFFPYLKTRES